MITLTTGQPGAGKTLWTLASVKAQAEKESRPVFFNGIADLSIPGWQHLDDPETWHQCPDGAIIIIDECQRVFRPRHNGSQVPAHVSALETHRHKGHDLYLVTQHPMLADTNVRRLVGRHYHVKRVFGTKRATVHEFGELRQDPEKTRDGSIRHEWNYPVEAYGWYKSAEVHTVKASIPVRLYMLGLLPLLVAALAWYAWQSFTRPVSAPVAPQGVAQATPEGLPAPRSVPPDTYLADYAPRVPGMLHTAPRYDEVMRPKSAPVPAGCVAGGDRCQCYTHQGTRLEIEKATCLQIAWHGFYDDTQPASRERVAQAPKEAQNASKGQAAVEIPEGYAPSVDWSPRDAGEIVPGAPPPERYFHDSDIHRG